MFVIGKRYSLGEIWAILAVPEAQRVDAWRSGLHEYAGSLYCLCSRFESSDKPFPHHSRVRLGQLYWEGGPRTEPDPTIARAIMYGNMASHLFFADDSEDDYFADDSEHGFEYLGRGLWEGFSIATGLQPSVCWEIDCGDGMLCLRKHCDALRRFCVYGPDQDGEAIDDPSFYQFWLDPATGWLELAAAIDSVQVDTLEFATGVNWDSVVRHYQAKRSELLSEVATALTFFTYLWMAAEQVIEVLNLPAVPRSLKRGGTSLIDRALFYLKCRMADDHEWGGMPGYRESIGRLEHSLAQDRRYRNALKGLSMEPHMNRWGMGLHIARRLRNVVVHGALQLPEPEDWSATEPRDVEVIEVSARLALFAIQLLLIAAHEEGGMVHARFTSDTARGVATASLRTLHLRNPQLDLT